MGKVRQIVNKFKELQGSPRALARGTAIGTFLGFAPVLPLKTMLILLITTLFPSSTVAAFLSCSIICNPLTYVPLYYVAWFLGDLMLPGWASWEILRSSLDTILNSGFREALAVVLDIGFDTCVVVLTGGLVLAIIPALIVYPLALLFFTRLQRLRREKQILK